MSEISKKILIVDDTPQNIQLLAEALEPCNYQIFQCKSGEECLDLTPKIRPDLILMDVMMGGIDGFETCRKLKSQEDMRKIPVIFITAKNQTEDLVEGFDSGGSDFINKPFLIEEVLLRVNHQLELQDIFAKNEALIQQLETQNKQLIQSEKMASIGQLVAGVAHEINNPTNFVSNNLDSICKEHKKLIEALNQIIPKTDESGKRLHNYLEPRFQSIAQMIDSGKEGVERISKIVKSLSDFSRHDEEHWVETNINEIVSSTLEILRFKLTEVDFRLNLGQGEKFCGFPAKLSQVVMNLVTNAIYAAKETRPHEAKVEVKTYENDEFVFVEVHDNGSGVAKEYQAKIFDPFFTTKPVGIGTGLGLSISYSIINDQHGGDLSFVSDSQGTCFTIKLPRNVNFNAKSS